MRMELLHKILVLRVLVNKSFHCRAAWDDGETCIAGIIQSSLDQNLGQALALESGIHHSVVEVANTIVFNELGETCFLTINLDDVTRIFLDYFFVRHATTLRENAQVLVGTQNAENHPPEGGWLLVARAGIEPATFHFSGERSTD